MAGRGDALDRALEELAGLGDDRDQEQIAALRDRLAAVRLRVLVAGEAKRGKSTLVNALLGRPLLPSGVTPLTAVATTEIFAGFAKLDRSLEEASADLGANPLQTLGRVTLPLMKTSLIGTALLVFTLSMDEIAVTFFLIGRENTLPLEIWSRLRRGATPEMNAISTLIFLFSLVTIFLSQRLIAGGDSEGKSAAIGEILLTGAAE